MKRKGMVKISREDIYLREAAWRYLLDQGINALPINAFQLAERNGYKVLTYIEFAAMIKKDVEYLITKYDNDGFVFWSKRQQIFVICYNSMLPPDVVRWTIIHEIAHIVLKHVTPDAPSLTRIRKIDHPFIEKEADGFTRRVLCPSIVLHDCQALEVTDIMKLCGISKTAAEHRSKYIKILEARSKYRTDPLEVAVEKQFLMFIMRYLRNKHMFEFGAEFAA